MPNLVVLTFDNVDEASQVRESIKKMEKQGQVSLDDSAILVKDEKGKIHVKNEMDQGVKIGALGGSLTGLFIGFLIGGPIGAAILGGAGGALVGSSVDLGIQKSFVKDVSDALKPGTSALFLIVREAHPNAAISVLKPYKGEVYHTSLDPEAEETLRRVLKERK